MKTKSHPEETAGRRAGFNEEAMASSSRSSLPRRPLAAALLVGLAVALFTVLWCHPWKTLTVILLSLPAAPGLVALFPGTWWRQGEPLPNPANDLERRRPVWSVLSELFLDTELVEVDLVRISAVLAESGYSVQQLEEILYRELHPVLHANLLSVAGEWAGFDQQWLEKRIIDRGAGKRGFALIPGKWMVRGEWAALQSKLEELVRSRSAASAVPLEALRMDRMAIGWNSILLTERIDYEAFPKYSEAIASIIGARLCRRVDGPDIRMRGLWYRHRLYWIVFDDFPFGVTIEPVSRAAARQLPEIWEQLATHRLK
jgi:hypothetical protein